jgi:hypothetical protein
MPTVICAGETFPQPSVDGQGDLPSLPVIRWGDFSQPSVNRQGDFPLLTVMYTGETFPQPSVNRQEDLLLSTVICACVTRRMRLIASLPASPSVYVL